MDGGRLDHQTVIDSGMSRTQTDIRLRSGPGIRRTRREKNEQRGSERPRRSWPDNGRTVGEAIAFRGRAEDGWLKLPAGRPTSSPHAFATCGSSSQPLINHIKHRSEGGKSRCRARCSRPRGHHPVVGHRRARTIMAAGDRRQAYGDSRLRCRYGCITLGAQHIGVRPCADGRCW